jgi:hypothetical protein
MSAEWEGICLGHVWSKGESSKRSRGDGGEGWWVRTYTERSRETGWGSYSGLASMVAVCCVWGCHVEAQREDDDAVLGCA